MTASASVVVTAGAVANLTASPAAVEVAAGSAVQLGVVAADACGHDVSSAVTWEALAGGDVDQTGLFTADCTPDTYPDAVRVSAGALVDHFDVTVTMGTAAEIVVLPATPTVRVGESIQLDATLLDDCGNEVVGEVSFSALGGGTVDADGLYAAGTVAGTWDEAVLATHGELELRVGVVVTAGPATALTVSPDPVVVGAGEELRLTVEAEDEFGNEFEPDAPDWEADSAAGSIDADGLLMATTSAGTYAEAITVAVDEATALVDVTVEPGPVSDVSIVPASPIYLTPTEAVQLSASTTDEFGNDVDEDVVWSVLNGGAMVNPTGFLTAGTVAGEYLGTIRAAAGNVESRADVVVSAGSPTGLGDIVPQSVSLAIGGQQRFVASVVDDWGNDTGVSPQWSVVAGGGIIVATGQDAGSFTAGTEAGVFEQTVRAAFADASRYADVTVLAGEAASIVVTPGTATLAVSETATFEAQVFDASGNLLDQPVVWSVVSGSMATISQSGRLSVGCSVQPGYHSGLVVATVGDVHGSADVEVLSGPTVYIAMGAALVEVDVVGQVTLEAEPQDECGHDTQETVSWSMPEGGGSISPAGVLTAGTVAGSFVARAERGDVSGETTVLMHPDEAVNVEVSPASVELVVGEEQEFTAEAEDRFGNTWNVDVAEWSALPEAGTIDSDGVFVAGTLAGIFENAVTATVDGEAGSADVTVLPSDPAEIAIAPEAPTVVAGQELQFEGTVTDEHGNEVPDAVVTFSVSDEAGTCTPDGLFAAGMSLGTFSEAVEGAYLELVTTTDVTVIAGDPATIMVDPETAVLAVGDTQEFVAYVYDESDVLIPDVAVTWEAAPDLGTIDAAGVLLVANAPGSYEGGVTATISSLVAAADVDVVCSSSATPSGCSEGYSCIDGECVESTPKPDVVVAPDAGAADTGQPDVGGVPGDTSQGGGPGDSNGGGGCSQSSRPTPMFAWLLFLVLGTGLLSIRRRRTSRD